MSSAIHRWSLPGLQACPGPTTPLDGPDPECVQGYGVSTFEWGITLAVTLPTLPS
jgi:hypothetical protein